MADAMMFPDTVEEFMEQYKMVDTDKVYSNGAEYVPIFRMEQWFDHVKHTQTHEIRTETHGVCSDELISRNAALALVVKAIHGTDNKDIKDYLFGGLRKELWALSSAEPKTGEWIEDAETFYKAVNEYDGGVDENTPYFTDDIACSKCLAKFSVIDNETERFDFCPNCGADMRGGDNEYDK